MNLPIIFAIDDDKQVLQALTRDLKNEYRKEYRVLSSNSPQDTLKMLPDLQNRNEYVCLFISDQRMPGMEGVDFLEQALQFYPDAKSILLTAYTDTAAAIKAINTVKLDYYLIKPWNPPEDNLYPVIHDLLEQWQFEYTPSYSGLRVIGYQFSPKSHDIKDFLAGNLLPYEWLDYMNSEKGLELIKNNALDPKDLPVVFFEDGTFLKSPEISDLAKKIGLSPTPSLDLYDVVVIGAGPSGLAASVYGSSEGLKTLLIEKHAPGGQAGTSSRIENYLGFPVGLSGADLTRRAVAQASRFGTEILSPQEVISITIKDQYKIIKLSQGAEIATKSLVITTGVNYRQLGASGIDRFTGAGVYYGSAITEAQSCRNRDIYIVGGGNSAGQAAMYLSKYACMIYIVVRKESLQSTMSSYLVDQIQGVKNIQVIAHTVVKEVHGGDSLEEITLENQLTNQSHKVSSAGLFIFIGANPFTEWINEDIMRDERGFLLTGRDLRDQPEFASKWKIKRDPYLLETSIPGIFAAGDNRSGAMNRVASAVGEGAMAISFVHKYLADF